MKTRKTSMAKKLLSIVLSITLLMSIVIVATPHVHAADEIEFVYTNGKRSGIKKIVIDGTTYYDIADGSSELNASAFAFYVDALTKDYNGNSVLDYWANIASLLFESAGTNYGYQDDGYSSDFDTFYTENTNNNSRDVNLIGQLSKKDAWTSGRVYTTGLGVTNSLKGAQSAMVQEIDDRYNQDVDDSKILRYTTGSSSGFAQMTEDQQDVIYNIVTTTDWNAGTTSFASFGIAFYDLKVVPLADDDLEFITAAEGYGSLAEAKQANAPGVTYNTTGNSTPFTSYVTNPSAAETVVTARYSEDSTTSVSNRIEETEVYSFAENISVATEFSASMPFVGDASVSTSIGFTTEQIISTAYSTENTLTQTITNETTAQVALPPHTQMGITQEAGSAEIKLDYDCPVYLTYKVMIFGMNGVLFLSNVDEFWETAQYDQGSICVGFGTGTSLGGLDAVSNLYNRAVTNRGIAGFEETYGNIYGYWDKWSDGNAASYYTSVNWGGFINSAQANSSGKTTLQCIEGLKGNIPLSAAGAEMTVASSSQNTSISPILPLYDLDEVKVNGNSVFTLRPGGMLDLGTVITQGNNEYGVPYYGYNNSFGEWKLCDAGGNVITSPTGISLTDLSGNQVITVSDIGTYYAKYFIDETAYDRVSGSGTIANSDLSQTAMIVINATNGNHTCVQGPWRTTIAPTCTTPGEQIACCTICGNLMATQPVPTLAHVIITTTTPATCTTAGVVTESCAICGMVESVVETAPLGHTHGAWHVVEEATCESDGLRQQFCSVCDCVVDSEIIPATGHTPGGWEIIAHATCTAPGEKQQCCSDCGEILSTQTIPALEHTLGPWITLIEAGCETHGEKVQYCTSCNNIINTETIESHGHAPAWITVAEATCSAVGREENVCTICGAVLETREIPRLEHVPGRWEITQEPTCTQPGLKQQCCALCGALLGDPVVIPPHEHQPGEFVTVRAATCEDEGEMVQSCTVCGGALATKAIAAHGHVEGTWTTVLEAGCETVGEQHLNCTRCGEILDSRVIEALGHVPGAWATVTEATCETDGEQHLNCTRCGELIETRRVEALGHVPGPAMTCVTDQVCLVCEEVLVPADGRSHVWTEWETYKEAGFFTEEEQRRECICCHIEEYRFVKGTSGCHRYFPHCDGSGEDCWACKTLSNSNGFFRNLGRFIFWFVRENIIATILFPFGHGHFHDWNLDKLFGTKE